jgi:hypothetical protein
VVIPLGGMAALVSDKNVIKDVSAGMSAPELARLNRLNNINRRKGLHPYVHRQDQQGADHAVVFKVENPASCSIQTSKAEVRAKVSAKALALTDTMSERGDPTWAEGPKTT